MTNIFLKPIPIGQEGNTSNHLPPHTHLHLVGINNPWETTPKTSHFFLGVTLYKTMIKHSP